MSKRSRTALPLLAAWAALLAVGLFAIDGLADTVASSTTGAPTPRALVQRFTDLVDEASYVEAARLVEPSRRSEEEMARLLKRLGIILDQYGPPEIDLVSSSAEGELDDKLPSDRERLPAPGDDLDGPGSLMMVRVQIDGAPRWLISRSTLAHVDAWYRAMPSRWLVERLPPVFAKSGPFGLQIWQWCAVGAALVLSLFGALAFARVTTALLHRISQRRKQQWDDASLLRLRGPLAAAWMLTLLRILLPLAAVPDRTMHSVMQLMRAALAGVVFWLAIAVVDAVRATMNDDDRTHPGRRALLGLGGRLLKMVMVLVALVVIMAELGFSVTSLVAGIGVGGLGLALAAQKTVENVFGAFSLGVDQPFREGDTITVDTVTGTVEVIGLRSTRIRTLDRTLVAIPNGKLAEMRTETLTARDRFRLRSVLALRPNTPAATVRKVCADIEELLRAHPKVSIDVQARVTSLSPSAIEVEVIASFLTTNGDEWTRIRQEMLLDILDRIEAAGTSLSPGAQSIEIVKTVSSTQT